MLYFHADVLTVQLAAQQLHLLHPCEARWLVTIAKHYRQLMQPASKRRLLRRGTRCTGASCSAAGK
jgi:hypothetical protein